MLLCSVLAVPLLIFPNQYSPAVLLLLPVGSLPTVALGGRQRTPSDVPLLLFLVIVFVTTVFAVDPSLGQAKLAGVVLGIAIYMALGSFSPTEQNVRRMASLLLPAGAAVAIVSMVGTRWVTYKLGAPVAIYERLPRLIIDVPGTAPFGFHPNEVGGVLALLVPLALVLSIRSSDRLLRSAAFVVFLLCAFVLVLTQSRSALFGTAVACLLALGLMNRFFRYAALLLAAIGAAWLAVLGAEGLKPFLASFDQFYTYSGSINFVSRLEIWQRALYVVRDFPFTGIGLGSFPSLSLARYPYLLAEVDLNYAHAHNFFLETAVDFGVGGLVIGLILLGTVGSMLWRTCVSASSDTSRAMALGIGAGLGAHLIYGLSDAVNWGAKPGIFLWVYMGIATLLWRTMESAQTARAALVSGQVDVGEVPGDTEAAATSHAQERRPGTGSAFDRLSRACYRDRQADRVTRIACGLLPAVSGLVLALTVAVSFRGPLVSAFENNLGSRELGKLALARERSGGKEGQSLPPTLYSAANRWLESATHRDPSNAAAWRNLASSYLAQGLNEAAAAALLRASTLEPGNLLLRYELARAHSTLGHAEKAHPLYVSLIEHFPKNRSLKEAEIDDYVLLNLAAGVERLAAGDPTAAATDLRRVLEVRPGELIASAYLAQALGKAGPEKEAAEARMNLRSFTLGTDARVYERHLPTLLPYLTEQGFLESGDLGRIGSYLLWKDVVDPVGALVDLLVQERVAEKDTWLLRAELNVRKDRKAAAVSDLKQVLALGTKDADVQFRLGQLVETDQMETALDAYRLALALDHNHVPALHAAAALLERQGHEAEADVLRRRLAVLVNEQRTVAQRLALDERDVQLLLEPLPNADFRIGRPHPTYWNFVEWVGEKVFGAAFYAGGVDERESYAGQPSLRISGLWAERGARSGSFWLDQQRGIELPRAGYWIPRVVLEGESIYALSFSYKTANWRGGNARVKIVVPEADRQPEDILADTEGRWMRKMFLFSNRLPRAVEVQPLLSSWGVGDLWFADIRVNKVVAKPGALLLTTGLPEIK